MIWLNCSIVFLKRFLGRGKSVPQGQHIEFYYNTTSELLGKLCGSQSTLSIFRCKTTFIIQCDLLRTISFAHGTSIFLLGLFVTGYLLFAQRAYTDTKE